MFTIQAFFEPILSIRTPIEIPPKISPIPKVIIASIESERSTFSVWSGGIVPKIMGVKRPVYTEIEIPVHANYGNNILIFLETSIFNTKYMSCLKVFL